MKRKFRIVETSPSKFVVQECKHNVWYDRANDYHDVRLYYSSATPLPECVLYSIQSANILIMDIIKHGEFPKIYEEVEG